MDSSVDMPRGSVIDTEPRFLVIGQISKPHGVQGDVRVQMHTDLPERFHWLETVYVQLVGRNKEMKQVAVEKVRFHQGLPLLKLAGYDDRESAKILRGAILYVPRSDAVPLAKGEYFLYQLLGLNVVTVEGEELGVLAEFIETKANLVFVVQSKEKDLLLPDTDEVVQDIDFDAGIMTVHLIPGLR